MRRVVIKNDKGHKTKTLDDYKINGFSQLFFITLESLAVITSSLRLLYGIYYSRLYRSKAFFFSYGEFRQDSRVKFFFASNHF